MNKMIIASMFALCASPAFAQVMTSQSHGNNLLSNDVGSAQISRAGIVNDGFIAVFTCYVLGANNVTYYSTAYDLPQAQFMAMQNCMMSGFMCQATGCQ